MDGTNHVLYQYIEETKTVTLSMRTVAIPNIDVEVWKCKSELPQGNFLRSLTKFEITRPGSF